MEFVCPHCQMRLDLTSVPPGAPFTCLGCSATFVQPASVTPALLPDTPPETNGLAIASLILSIVAIIVPIVVPSLVAILLGLISRRKIKANPTRWRGKGLALAGIIVGFVGLSMFAALLVEQARIHAAKSEMQTLAGALELYQKNEGAYPATKQGLAALVVPPQQHERNLRDNKVPLDPWGNPYVYQCDDGHVYIITSMGPDGKPGTQDDVTR